MAKCFDVTGYVEPCNVVRQKYTGRALLITKGVLNPSSSGNGIVISKINECSSFSGPDGFDKTWSAAGGILLPVIIDAQNPFGVTIQGNTDSGRVLYTKTIPVSIPATRDDGLVESFIMGLQNGLYGSAAIVLETFGNSNKNDIFGVYSPLRLDPTSVTRSEYENGGAWNFNLVCEEPLPNVICTMTGLEAVFDGII